ncbi:MAG: hypothetical protein MUE97_08260 [Phycisphaerales bacterium]|nr:hypothetical protein [Phycisphaerales bacterium]
MIDALFSSPTIFFTVPALAGTLLFVIKIILMLVGGDADTDVDGGGHDSSTGEWFSLGAIGAFVMGFGWGGLAGLRSFQLEVPWAVLCGVAAGMGLAGLMVLLLRQTRRLASSGNIDTNNAVGLEGDVYLTVPERGKGRGQVKLVIQGRQQIFFATSTGPAIASGGRCKVTAAAADGILTVSPIA